MSDLKVLEFKNLNGNVICIPIPERFKKRTDVNELSKNKNYSNKKLCLER